MTEKELAKHLAASPLLPKLLDAYKTDTVEAWESATDTNVREAKWFLVKAIEGVREYVDTRVRELAGDGRAND